MASKTRLCVPGAVHHITSKLIENRTLFFDQTDKQKFLQLLNNFLNYTGFDLLGINFYQTHYHIVLRINNRPLEDLFRGFHSAYARFYNKRHGFNGYLFQGRPKSVAIQDGEPSKNIITYLHTGPIRAGLCTNIEELDRFEDGTHSAIMDNFQFPNLRNDQVLSFFGDNKSADSKILYRQSINHYIENGDYLKDFISVIKCANQDKQNKFKPGYWVIGDNKFVKDAFELDLQRRIQMAQHKISGWDHDKLADFVSSKISVPVNELKTRGRMNPISDARKLYCYFAILVLDMSRSSTAVKLNISRTAVAKLAKQGRIRAQELMIELPEINFSVPIK